MTDLRTAPSRLVRRVVTLALASTALAAPLAAQPVAEPAGVHTLGAPPLAFTPESRVSVRIADRGDRVFDHTVNGALIGAGAGLVYAYILSQSGGTPGEGLPVFIVLPPVGAVLGAVVGTVVGLVRTTPPRAAAAAAAAAR